MTVGCTRDVNVIPGLPTTTNTERLDLLDDENYVMGFTIIGGEHWLRNYHVVTTMHEIITTTAAAEENKRPVTVVLESYVVDVLKGTRRRTREAMAHDGSGDAVKILW
ncbi:hypothetical protein L6452_08363 [Arctium lappa]|uniref:Uncharacterized protein n=1 Tax=Arctium lappa TaxID=4217 RepID=A0ACB9DHE6_ARCLA|nr:hypothetical protein L6452_08363 [Arctium lappa]